MDIKEEVKDESSFPNSCSENEKELFMKKVKIETVTSSSNIKPELEDSTWSQNEEPNLLRFNETIRESEIETKIVIKEDSWWLDREDSCIDHDIKDETYEDLYSSKPPRISKEGVCSYTSDLLSGEDTGNEINFIITKDSVECESDRKGHKQDSLGLDISSVETSVCSETSHEWKIVSMPSSSKQSKLLQQSNSNKPNCKAILNLGYRNSYECDVSEKYLKYLPHLENDRLLLNSKETKKCDVQDKGLNQPSSLKTQKLIDVKRTHLCNTCNKAFTHLSHLKRHKLIHEGLKPHKCNICNKAFTESSSLKRHKLIHNMKSHKCYICNKAFTELLNLKSHKLIHEGIKAHKCEICDKGFTELSNLKRHKLIHEGMKPHKCYICKKAFTKLSNFKSHKLIHEGIKPHKCDTCDKAFTHSSNLKTHKLIHEGIKPHKCNICSKAFTDLSALKRHKLIHEGIKPHECNICNKAFTHLSSFKRHEVIHKDTLV